MKLIVRVLRTIVPGLGVTIDLCYDFVYIFVYIWTGINSGNNEIFSTLNYLRSTLRERILLVENFHRNHSHVNTES